jgi:hypothetical protein
MSVVLLRVDGVVLEKAALILTIRWEAHKWRRG